MSSHEWIITAREYDDTFFRCSRCGAETHCKRGYPESDGCLADDEAAEIDPRLDEALNVFAADVVTSASEIGFGTDPGDSCALGELRVAIDEHLPWPDEATEDAGDYVAHVKYIGEQLIEAKARVLALDAALTKLTSDRDRDLKRAGEEVRRFRRIEIEARLIVSSIDSGMKPEAVVKLFGPMRSALAEQPEPEPDAAS